MAGGFMDAADDLVAVALLAEPVRQRLYLYLRERRVPVGREEAAGHAGIAVRLAAFHLDRMADAGLLEVEYRRLSGRVGPGAGRPAKLYSVSSRSFSVVIPQTRYALAASMMATALSAGSAGADGADSLHDVATSVGERLGADIRRQARTKGSRRTAVERKLKQLGYEPREQASGELTLRNCIFSELSMSHRELVCPMNAAFVAGLLDGARLRSLRVERRRAEPTCCVQITGR
jgi:predicted ArsR family transcriptional regulator